jgi:hypothetical protein
MGYLQMRSAIIPPIRIANQVQRSLDHQPYSFQNPIQRAIGRNRQNELEGIATRPSENTALNFLTLSSSPRINLFSNDLESSLPATIPQSSSTQGDSFYSSQAVNNSIHFPLSQPYVVQRKATSSEGYAASEAGSNYLQRLESINTGVPSSPVNLANANDIAGSVTGKSDSDALSTEDVVDKVWRKLMRKLVSEQERMGGSNKWA